jgi:hypothetical protein
MLRRGQVIQMQKRKRFVDIQSNTTFWTILSNRRMVRRQKNLDIRNGFRQKRLSDTNDSWLVPTGMRKKFVKV